MYRLEEILSVLNDALDTKQKRHIAGGILLSISLLFGGLAFTIMTIKLEEENSERYLE